MYFNKQKFKKGQFMPFSVIKQIEITFKQYVLSTVKSILEIGLSRPSIW